MDSSWPQVWPVRMHFREDRSNKCLLETFLLCVRLRLSAVTLQREWRASGGALPPSQPSGPQSPCSVLPFPLGPHTVQPPVLSFFQPSGLFLSTWEHRQEPMSLKTIKQELSVNPLFHSVYKRIFKILKGSFGIGPVESPHLPL